MATKTAPRTLDQVQAEHAALLARAEAGDTIDPLELLRAEADLTVAQAASTGNAKRAADAAEVQRLTRINELAAIVTSRPDRAARLVALHDAAVAALTALHAEALGYVDELGAVDAEFRALGDLPDIRLSRLPNTITIAGFDYEAGHNLPAMLLVDAASSAASNHGVMFEGLHRDAARFSTHRVVDQLRSIATT